MQSVDIILENLVENYKLNYIAKQAFGSVWYRSGGSVLLASVAVEESPIDGEFLPLTVQYLQKSYAIRKIPGGFIKREGKPSEFEILTSRLIDRTLRPLFPVGYCYPTQITIFVLSYDGVSDLQVCALHAAANALLVSGFDFIPPVSSVRIGKVKQDFIINPTMQERKDSVLDLYVSGTRDEILMIEMKGSDESLDEEELCAAIALAQKVISKDSQNYDNGLLPFKAPIRTFPPRTIQTHPHIYTHIANHYAKEVKTALLAMSKSERSSELDSIAHLVSTDNPEWDIQAIQDMLRLYKKHQVRTMILQESKRADGRGLEEIRPISIETNILPCAHSSALFTRGQTQALVVCTLGSDSDAQTQEDFDGSTKEKFMLHYNFPAFSVGEAGMIGNVGRRELGHGNLAKKALESSISDVPHTIRLVSEILESNGSSSMASVCGGSLALRACGLTNNLVAGVAMGLVIEGDQYAVLTDIMGLEDHDGDMDFKVAGTRNCITAMQMDIKLGGIDSRILKDALYQAKRARMQILRIMEEAAEEIVLNDAILPKSERFDIPSNKIPDIIGQGGKTIKNIIERFKVSIDIDKEQSILQINAESKQSLAEAKAFIQQLITPQSYKNGEIIDGIIKKITDFGIFVQLPKGNDGLLHISKIPNSKQPLSYHFNEGEVLQCEIIGSSKGKVELALASF